MASLTVSSTIKNRFRLLSLFIKAVNRVARLLIFYYIFTAPWIAFSTGQIYIAILFLIIKELLSVVPDNSITGFQKLYSLLLVIKITLVFKAFNIIR